MGGARRSMTWRQFILVLGLHTAEEMAEDGFDAYWLGSERLIPDKRDLSDYWVEISSGKDFLRGAPSYTYIRDPYLFRHAEGRKSGARLSEGYFIGRLAQHFGLVSDDGLRGLSVVSRELPLIDMGELVKLNIFMDLGDDWAWVVHDKEFNKQTIHTLLIEEGTTRSHGGGKITTWEELVETFFYRFYPESYDGEDEMLDEGDNWGIDPINILARRNTSFKNHKKVDERTKKVLFHVWMNGNLNKRRIDDSILRSNNTTTDSFFIHYLITHGKSDTEKEDEQSQTKRKNSNTSNSIDEQPNKRRCKAEKFEAIQYSLRPNKEYVAIRGYEFDIWERNDDNLSIIYQDIFLLKDLGWKVGKKFAAYKMGIVITEYLVNISKRRAFWSLNEDILKITILKTNTPYPSRKIRRIRAYTHQRPQRKEDQYAVSRRSQYAVLKI
ncbi:hypothetical protein Tco_1212549 [Tanacetum coccineum]